MRVWTLFLVVAAVVGLAPGAGAQPRPARPRLTVLADSVSAGERVRMAVAVDHAAGRSVVFPDVPAGSAEAGALLAFGDAEALSVRRLPPTVRGGVRTDSAVYDVAVFAVDTARVGPVTVRVASGRDTLVLRTGVARVPVRSALTAAERAGEAAPAPVGPPDPFPGLLPVWLALGAILVALVGLGTWAWRRWQRRPQPPAPRAAPYPEALAALDALGASPDDGAPDDGAPGDAAPDAARRALGAREALRVYLARRLGVPALETTTAELDAALAADARVPPDARAAARRVLDLADLVAFAGHSPTPAAAADVLAHARTAVDGIEAARRPPAVPPAVPAGAS